MKVITAQDYSDMSKKAANIIAAQVTLVENSVLGLATGSTPIGIYEQLVDRYGRGELDFSRVTTINLDEYCGLAPQHPQSYRYFMDTHLFSKVNLEKKNTHLPLGTTDPAQEGARYDALIESCGGIDLQLLGIGHNGHIGFNEPGDAFVPPTHCVALSEETLRANARFFEDAGEMPRQAVTMGMRAIMQAKRVLLVASGPDKADILNAALYGPVTPRVPASILQLHPDLTVVADTL